MQFDPLNLLRCPLEVQSPLPLLSPEQGGTSLVVPPAAAEDSKLAASSSGPPPPIPGSSRTARSLTANSFLGCFSSLEDVMSSSDLPSNLSALLWSHVTIPEKTVGEGNTKWKCNYCEHTGGIQPCKKVTVHVLNQLRNEVARAKEALAKSKTKNVSEVLLYA